MMRQYKDPRKWRFELVRYTKKTVSNGNTYFNTTPKTVRKWLAWIDERANGSNISILTSGSVFQEHTLTKVIEHHGKLLKKKN